MKNYILSILLFFNYLMIAQSNNYYESCNGLEGEALKEELRQNNIKANIKSYNIIKHRF